MNTDRSLDIAYTGGNTVTESSPVSMTAEGATRFRIPADPTGLPCGPDSIDVEPLHLSITKRWDNGGSQNIHLLENGDITVLLKDGQAGHAMSKPIDRGETGTVIITLDVDSDHHEVHYETRLSNPDDDVDVEELLAQAAETLAACRYAVRKTRR